MTRLTPTRAPRAGRVYQLDAIRGVLAIGVLLYHIGEWTRAWDLPALGTFGVYAFFVLSGFALEHVYGTSLQVRQFALARIARLAPLWIAAVLATVVINGNLHLTRLGLNLTGLFGFVHPGSTSLVAGGWSIGIEVVCYVVFVALAWRRLSSRSLAVLIGLAFLLRVVYASGVWPVGSRLTDVWVAYTEIPSYLVFFLAGMGGARLAATGSLVRFGQWPFIVSAAVMGVAMLTNTGDIRELLVGPLSLVLVGVVTVGIAIAGSGAAWTGRPAQVATWLGDLSYGTYLLHPIVFAIAPPVVVLTPLLALAVHRVYEVPVGRWIRSRRRVRRLDDQGDPLAVQTHGA